MRLAFVSDLHVDYRLEVAGLVARAVRSLDADALLVAGDICPRLGRLASTLRLLCENVKDVLFVAGNHDLWSVTGDTSGPLGKIYDSRARYLKVLPELTQKAGAIYLGLAPYVLEDIAFVGVTGWYDYSLRSSTLDEIVPMSSYRAKRFRGIEWMDGRYMNWPDDSGNTVSDSELSSFMTRKLGEQLDLLKQHTGRVVVTTHMLTHKELARPTGDLRHDFSLAYSGSDELGRIIDAHPGVCLLVSGHLHKKTSITLVGRHGPYRCEVSPVGYPKEYAGQIEAHVRKCVGCVDL